MNEPFHSFYFYHLKKINFVRSKIYRSFSIYFVCFLTKLPSINSFVQKNRLFNKIIRSVKTIRFLKSVRKNRSFRKKRFFFKIFRIFHFFSKKLSNCSIFFPVFVKTIFFPFLCTIHFIRPLLVFFSEQRPFSQLGGLPRAKSSKFLFSYFSNFKLQFDYHWLTTFFLN